MRSNAPTRVAPWIPAKFAARLQAATSSGKPVLQHVLYDAGHGMIDATRHQLDAGPASRFAFARWQTGDPAFRPGKK